MQTSFCFVIFLEKIGRCAKLASGTRAETKAGQPAYQIGRRKGGFLSIISQLAVVFEICDCS